MALRCNFQRLILRGATVDYKGWSWVYMGRKIKLVRRPVLAWAKAELAQNHDHRFFDLVLGCGVHGSRDVPPAQRSPLLKLRGDGHTNARALIWRCLSRRTRTELGRLRQAVSVLQSEEDEYAMQVQEWDEEDPYGDLEGRHTQPRFGFGKRFRGRLLLTRPTCTCCMGGCAPKCQQETPPPPPTPRRATQRNWGWGGGGALL